MELYIIKKSNIDKRGLYASKNIKKDTKIIEYVEIGRASCRERV